MKRKLNAPLSVMIDVIQLLYDYVYLVCKKQQSNVWKTHTVFIAQWYDLHINVWGGIKIFWNMIILLLRYYYLVFMSIFQN